jgi:hypothetical protein
MDQSELVESVKKIDLRLDRIEQFLPTQATKDELRTQALATKEELRAAVAPLATSAELREESERTRRHSQVLFESLRDDIRIVAEAQASTLVELRSMSQQHRKTLDNHELRLVRLESDTRPGSPSEYSATGS